MEDRIIGLELRDVRKAHDMSQEELADLVEITTKTLKNYEKGYTKLPAHILFKILYELDSPDSVIIGFYARYAEARLNPKKEKVSC